MCWAHPASYFLAASNRLISHLSSGALGPSAAQKRKTPPLLSHRQGLPKINSRTVLQSFPTQGLRLVRTRADTNTLQQKCSLVKAMAAVGGMQAAVPRPLAPASRRRRQREVIQSKDFELPNYAPPTAAPNAMRRTSRTPTCHHEDPVPGRRWMLCHCQRHTCRNAAFRLPAKPSFRGAGALFFSVHPRWR
jgi:hypothetical protein